MKFFTKKVQEKQKVDPRSQKFVDTIQLLLEDHGITNKRALNECSHQLLKASHRFYSTLKAGDDYDDADVMMLEEKFREIMASYGITEEDAQDEIFIGFFGTLNELGAEGVKE